MTQGFSGAVLAGGASSRMGTDKALVRVGGRRLVEIAVGALHDAGAADVVVVGGDQAALEALGLTWIPDQFPGQGPLGGLITALDAATEDVAVVLACDHPSTEGPAVRAVVGALGTADAAIPVVEGRQQVLHAAWRTGAREALRVRFSEGARSIREGVVGLSLVQILDGDPCWFADADTPDDLQ